MFTKRTSKPGAGNKCYITRNNGGWSWCIQGSPTDSQCDVLANCVGYACGRFNEIYNELKGTTGMKYYALNCNAEDFIARAKSIGLEISDTPVKGGIMVWQGAGSLAGHVAVVEEVYDDNHIYTSESGYGGSAFWNSNRYNNNGRWGSGANYPYIGCIINPAVGRVGAPEKPAPKEPTPAPKYAVGDNVVIQGDLYVSSNASGPAGYTSKKRTVITRVAPGSAHPYNTTGDLGWMNEDSISLYVEEEKPRELAVGDKVKIINYGCDTSYGSDRRAGGLGWEREILQIYPGRSYPYRVGNASGTTGFYRADALQRI